MSPDSRYRRFLTLMERLDARQLRYLTTLDHDRQEALVAIDAATGEAVAVARYAAIADDDQTAEIAVAVSDPWQRRGLGQGASQSPRRERSRPRHPPPQRPDAHGQQCYAEAHDLDRADHLTHRPRGYRRTGGGRRLGGQRRRVSISTLTPVLARGPGRARVDHGAGRRHVDRHGESARAPRASDGRPGLAAAPRRRAAQRPQPLGATARSWDLVSAPLVRELPRVARKGRRPAATRDGP